MPRSGSTLLQKVLASHSSITSVAEPWLLLPLIELDNLGEKKYYNGPRCNLAIKDFFNTLPNRRNDYLNAVGNLMKDMYFKKIGGDKKYFIDKTPNYYRIVPDIHKALPEAKYIFLFRNPAAIYSSMMETWYKGRFITSEYLLRDLMHGTGYVASSYKLIKDKSVKVIYEDFVLNPAEELKKITAYLGIEFEESMLTNFRSVDLKSSFNWDKISTGKYNSISSESAQKWKKSFGSYFKKKIIEKYISKNADENYLTEMNSSREILIGEIRKIKSRSPGIIHLMDYYYSSLLPKIISSERRQTLKKKLGLYKSTLE